MKRSAIAISLLLVSSVTSQAQQTRWDSTARSLFKELVEINTTESRGSTLAAARAMAARLKAAGFPDSDVVVLQNDEKKGNLVVRLHGRSTGKKPILLLSHIDVVEANAEDWTLPPFQFIEKDGTFFGRGVADDKDEGAIHLALIMRMREEKFVPDRDIIVALTADEEGGGANGVSWLIQNHRSLIDAEYAFNEGGGGRVRGPGITDTMKVSHDVQASEKKFLNFRFEVTNPGGHSSVPRSDNAITQLAVALTKINPTIMPVHLNEVTRAYFTRLADVIRAESPQQAAAMRAIVANPNDAAAAAVLSADPRYNSQLRTSCVPTMLEGGHATNALPQRARANVNCRILPDETPDQVRAILERVVGDTGVRITFQGSATNSPPSPLTPALMGEIERVTKEMWPGIPVIPTMSTGATDGLRLRNVGIPVYGVSGLFYPETFAHGMNERIPVRAFYQGLEFMYRLVKGITGGPRPIS
jgi:acetylornithine deacetylase/succinyl-diaminopimelate desuccinylase-like protein